MVEDLQTAEFKEAFDEFDVVSCVRSELRTVACVSFSGVGTLVCVLYVLGSMF